jgi:hypothetical protein
VLTIRSGVDACIRLIVEAFEPEKPVIADTPVKLMTESHADQGARGTTNDHPENAAANFANPSHR